MNPLSRLITLSDTEKQEHGLVHTPAEIAQQPATWQTTYRLFAEAKSSLAEFLRPGREGQWTIYLVGAGTSDYVGQALSNLLRQRWGCEVRAVASTDLLTNRDDLLLDGRRYLWISFSRSGDSPEGVAVLEQALASCPNVRHLVVSCNASGKMVELARQSKEAFAIVLDDAVNDRSLAMTSSFTNMLVFGQALAHLWEPDHYEETLAHMAVAANHMLDAGSHLAYELAGKGHRQACFVGAGGLRSAAQESALKLLELTSGRVLTMSETTLGLRHGPMSALNMQTIFTSYVSTGEKRQKYDLDLLREIRAKEVVRTIVAVGVVDSASDHSLHCAAFEHIDDAYRPAVDILFGQMLGLFSSIELGLKPDSPSPKGVISRVVQKFNIYS
ncbi:MAG: putative tagatose-6-phosphate aldose/ketose isomerase [Edaphobacter sp.]|nr:putative tagatose-6-phosphate aldose/ketose isomerase [Edaphobacter sp.]